MDPVETVVTHESLPGASVTVRPATYRMGLRRTILTEQERKLLKDRGGEEDLASAVGASMIYPTLIAATVAHEGFETWPPSSDQVMDLPEGFVTAWENAAYELNPQWRAVLPEEKKASRSSTPALSDGQNVKPAGPRKRHTPKAAVSST